MAKYHIGVDVGKNRHHISIRDLSKDVYYKTFSVSCDRKGFLEFASALEKLSTNKDDFLIGVEACGPYGVTLSYFLLGLGYKLGRGKPIPSWAIPQGAGEEGED